MYIGDADRTEATQLLGEHFQHGRLDADEYGQRLQIAVSARTRGQLRSVFTLLPPPWPTCMRPEAPPPAIATQPITLTVGHYPVPGQLLGQSDKSKVVAGVLQIALPFGVGRFYTGHTGLGVAQLLVVLFTCGFAAIWPVIDGIVLLVSGGTDSYGRPLR
jgi:TM2 domain-containing membrane protein YozV